MNRQTRTESDDDRGHRWQTTHLRADGTVEHGEIFEPRASVSSHRADDAGANSATESDSPRERLIAGTANAWKSKKQRELDRRGEGAATPRDAFIQATADIAKPKAQVEFEARLNGDDL